MRMWLFTARGVAWVGLSGLFPGSFQSFCLHVVCVSNHMLQTWSAFGLKCENMSKSAVKTCPNTIYMSVLAAFVMVTGSIPSIFSLDTSKICCSLPPTFLYQHGGVQTGPKTRIVLVFDIQVNGTGREWNTLGASGWCENVKNKMEKWKILKWNCWKTLKKLTVTTHILIFI